MSLATVFNNYTYLYSGYNGLGRSTTGRGTSTISGYFNNITSAGQFLDVDYDVHPGEPATRLRAMTIAYLERSTSPNYLQPASKTKIAAGLNYYITAEKNSPSNWFYMVVEGPSAILDACLKLRTGNSFGFTDSELAAFSDGAPWYFDQLNFSSAEYPTLGTTNRMDSDSANTVMFLDISIRKALFKNNSSQLTTDMNRVKTFLRNMWVNEHGSKSDYSFHHHVGLNYLGGSYGQVYFRIFSELMYCTQGTQWEFSQNEKNYLIDLMMNGLAYVQHRGKYDFIAKHKEWPWQNNLTIEPSIFFVQNLKDIGYRLQDINKFSDYLTGTQNVPNSIRNFYTSNTMVYKRDGWHQRVNYPCTRQLRWTESFEPDKSIYGMYLGSTMTLITGNEILNLAYLCQPNRLPGATLRDFTLANTPYLSLTGGVDAMREYPIFYAGGVNSQDFAAVIYNFQGHFDITAKKFYFMTPVGMFCMGTNITSIDTIYPENVTTAIEQKIFTGTATISRNGVEQTVTSLVNHNDINWAWQGNVGYIIPGNQNIKCSYLSVTQNATAIMPETDSKSYSGNIFSLWIDHGKGLTNGVYQYAVIPNITIINFRTFVNPFTVLQNDSKIQAVKYGNDVYAVSFQERAFLKLEEGITISASGPGIYIFEFNSARTTLKINVSDPVGIPEMKLEISKKLSGSPYIKYNTSKSTLLEFKANSGEFIGKPLEMNLTIINPVT